MAPTALGTLLKVASDGLDDARSAAQPFTAGAGRIIDAEDAVDGVKAAKLLSFWSGVIARERGNWVDGALDGAVDQENAGVIEFCELALCLGCPVHPEGVSLTAFRKLSSVVAPFRPRTSLSKSSSPLGPTDLGSREALKPPKDGKSLVLSPDAVSDLDVSSWSFRDCSFSIRDDNDLIKVMNSWNCCKFSNGPRLKLQRIGRTSIARKSESAILPTCLNAFRAAIMTAGSLVLMAFSRGTIFSCIVYLSSTALLEGFTRLLFRSMIPSNPSPADPFSSPEPPQSIAKASSPRTLIPRLLVLLKTAAISGNNSFLSVEKSRTGSITGSVRRAASMTGCVDDSRPRPMMGSMSISD